MEPGGHLGRITFEGPGSSDINNHWFRNSLAVGGLAEEFDPRIGAARGKSGPVYKFASSVAEKVLLAWLNEHQVPYQLDAPLHSASKEEFSPPNSIPGSGPPAASQAPSTSSHRRSPRRCYSLVLTSTEFPTSSTLYFPPPPKKRSRHRIPSQDRGRPRQVGPRLQVRIVGRREGVTRFAQGARSSRPAQRSTSLLLRAKSENHLFHVSLRTAHRRRPVH